MSYIGSGPCVSLWAMFLLAAFLWVMHNFGNGVLRFFPPPLALSRGERVCFSLGIGLVSVTLALFILGANGFVSRQAALATVVAFAALPFFAPSPALPRVHPSRQGGSPFSWVLWTALAGAFFLSWVQALAPAVGMDAMAYHLYLPKEFIRLGKMSFLPLTRESLWPLNTEMLFMAGLLFQGTMLAQLAHWIFYPLTTFAVYFCARRFYGPVQALWAAVFFTFTPVVFAQSGYPYVDISLAFFIFMAVYAFILTLEADQPFFYALSGFFCGAAMGTKYLGLGCLLILAGLIAVRTRFNFKKCSLFLFSAGLIGGGWYLRSWWIAGNPVFPLFHHLFGGHGYSVDIAAGVSMGKGPLAFLLFPWNVTMYPRKFGGEMIGVFYLIFLPFLLFQICRARAVSRYLATFGFLYVTFIFTQSQHVRFLIAALPVLAIGCALALTWTFSRGRILRITAFIVIASLLVLHSGIFVYRLKNKWIVVAGKMPPHVWLSKYERSFKGFNYIQARVKPSEKILNAAEVRYFYAPDNWRVAHLAQENVRLRKEGIQLEDYLREEDFDCIWITDLSEPVLLAFLRKNGYKLAFHYDFKEKPDIFRNYIYRRPAQVLFRSK